MPCRASPRFGPARCCRDGSAALATGEFTATVLIADRDIKLIAALAGPAIDGVAAWPATATPISYPEINNNWTAMQPLMRLLTGC